MTHHLEQFITQRGFLLPNNTNQGMLVVLILLFSHDQATGTVCLLCIVPIGQHLGILAICNDH